MRIVFTSYVSSPEFEEPLVWLNRINGYTGILEGLSKNHEVIGIEKINYKGDYFQDGVQYCFLKQRKKVLLFPFRLHQFIKKLQPDIVFINGFIFPLQIIQLRLTQGKKTRIFILHRAEKPYKGIKRWLQKLADKCVRGYLFTSFESAAEWIKCGIIQEQNKVHEIIQGSSRFRVTRPQLPIVDKLDFLWVGRLDANKDPVTVIKAFIKFLQVQPSARLNLVYQDAPLLEELLSLIKTSEAAKKAIKFIGPIEHQQLEEWYNKSDFIISGSHYEGSGIAVCEAMSCGCIPIVTDIPSFRKMTGGKCGFLYKPGDDATLLKLLCSAKDMDIGAERKKVLEQFRNELSFEAITKKIEKIISN
jgi:glycosyltransferase involved in cell wall biosynthesis